MTTRLIAMLLIVGGAAQARDMHPDYRSASCDDVARSVDREMTLRKSLATLTPNYAHDKGAGKESL